MDRAFSDDDDDDEAASADSGGGASSRRATTMVRGTANTRRRGGAVWIAKRAPGGSRAANAPTVWRWHWPPIVGSFITTVLPESSAGISIAYISFSG